MFYGLSLSKLIDKRMETDTGSLLNYQTFILFSIAK